MKRVPDVRPPRRRWHEKGVAAVELAIVLPLLTFLLLTIVDLGLVLREYQALQNAAREGARFSIHPLNAVGTYPGASYDAIRARVVEYMAQEGIAIDAAAVAVTQLDPVPAPGGITLRCTRITVTYSRALLIAGGGILPAGELTIGASSVFENLY